MTRFRRLFLATAIATYILVVIGGTVRVTGSGEACPDWPTCNGRLIPSFSEHVLIEYSHRLFASVVSVLVVVSAIAAWRYLRSDRTVVALASGAVLVLVAQVVLGAVTVKQKLPARIVTAHLGTAMLLFAVVTLLVVASFPGLRRTLATAQHGSAGARTVRLSAFVAAAGMYTLLLSGAYLASSNEGLACSTWPLCNGQLFAHGNRGVELHMLHRGIVVVVTVLLGVLVYVTGRFQSRNLALRRAVRDALALFVLQIALGAMNIWTELATGIRILHLATGAALWAVLVVIAWMGYAITLKQPSPAPRKVPVAAGRSSPEVIG